MKQFFTGLIIGLSVMFLIAAVGKGPNMENGGYDGGKVYAGHFPKYMPPYWLAGYMAGATDASDLLSAEIPSSDRKDIYVRMENIKAGAEFQKLNMSSSVTYRVPMGCGAAGPADFGYFLKDAEIVLKSQGVLK